MSDPKKARPTQRRKALTQSNPLQDILLTPNRQCSAISKRTGERCKNLAMTAQRTCRMHGGATRKARVAAAKRIADASGYAADMLVELMADPTVDIKQRTAIAQDLLTRAGISGKQQVEVEVRNYEDVLDTVLVDVAEPESQLDNPNVEDAVIVVDEPKELESVRDAETAERDVQRRRRAARGKSPAAAPSEQAAVDRKFNREAHERFLAERLDPAKPARYKRNRP